MYLKGAFEISFEVGRGLYNVVDVYRSFTKMDFFKGNLYVTLCKHSECRVVVITQVYNCVPCLSLCSQYLGYARSEGEKFNRGALQHLRILAMYGSHVHTGVPFQGHVTK